MVISHGPAAGFVDSGEGETATGCPDLAKQLRERIQPRLFVCGHIHSAHGELLDKESGTHFVNAASVKRGGGLYEPIVVELDFPRVAIASDAEQGEEENAMTGTEDTEEHNEQE